MTETAPTPWYRAAQYDGEQPAGRAYGQAQETIYQNECDLAAYRMMLQEIWHVAVLGGEPAEMNLQQKLEHILYTEGTPAELPEDVVVYLAQRHEQARKIGPWVEGHYRPGKVVKRRKR